MMTTLEAHAAAPRQRVLDHVAAVFGLSAASVDVVALAPRDLPPGAAEFFVEPKGSHGHDGHNCIVLGERVYCSGAEGEFTRLLREQRLTERADLGADELMRLYALFALPRQVRYLDAGGIARNADLYRAFEPIAPPALARAPDGTLTLTFVATPVQELEPAAWTVTITPRFEVGVTSRPLARR